MKHIKILVLTGIMVLLCAGTCFATEFIDVPHDGWFYPYVNELSDQGIINGVGNGCYEPLSNVKHVEALKLVLCAAGYGIEDIVVPESDGYWWGSNIVATANKYGIATMGTYDPLGYATREQVCDYIVKGMGWQNASHPDGVFKDTDSDIAEILYMKGIVTGSPEWTGYYFNGNSIINRAESATLIYRMYHYDPLELRPLTGFRDALGFEYVDPIEVSDWQKILIYMGRNNLTEYTAKYTGPIASYSKELRQKIMDNAITAAGQTKEGIYDSYHEYQCYFNQINVNDEYSNGTYAVTLKLSNVNFLSSEIIKMRGEFFAKEEAAVKEMIAEGLITADMTEREKAAAVFDWVCKHCEYDRSSADNGRYFGYNAIVKGSAVCQGYTALYNSMCKSLGIWCAGIAGQGNDGRKLEDHIWTYASLEGTHYHIDVTYADTSERDPAAGNYKYFCATDKEIAKDHIWN